MKEFDTIPPALMAAFSQLLRPLVRMFLHFNITYPVLSRLLKSIYVEVAEHDIPISGKQQSDSRITFLTGVHRKDVRRLRQEPDEAAADSTSATLGAQLVARWTGLPEFMGHDGHPKPLPRLSQDAATPSFEALVQTQSKDIRARVVLDEWLRLGVVHVDQHDQVWLNTEAFVPDSGLDEKSYFMGRNLRDHIAACAHNITHAGPPMLERSVYYDSLTDDDIAELEAASKEIGMQSLQLINRKAMALQQLSDGKPNAARRMNFGLYFFHAPDDVHNEAETNNDEDSA
jgi:hypothetical protein